MQTIIYFNNKPLYLISELNKETEELLHHEETVFIDEFNQHTVKAMIHEMEMGKIKHGVFLHNDVDAVLKTFKKKLKLIIAAGGLVYTPEHEILLIHRHGKWDLPKGKLDEKESLETCAVREIAEETGLNNHQVEKPLTVTYHTYHQDGKHILKESHWFLMKSSKQIVFTPQTEEGITKCEWVEIDNLASYMENTHRSIIDVVNAGIKYLHETKNV
jgi:ADP-ribose pyrophosphatase YjhB (NUDIX family)